MDLLFSVLEDSAHVNDTSLKGCKTPIVIVIPGLTSDSTADVSLVFCVFCNFYMP